MSADAPAASAAAAAATATTVADFPAFRDAQSGTMGPAPDARIISKFPEGVDLSNIRKIMAAAAQLKKSVIADVDPFWGRLAQFTPDTDIEAFTESLIDNYHTDFAVAWTFWPDFLVQMMYAGWLITADSTGRKNDGSFKLQWPLPKLHQQRCLLTDWSKLAVHSSTLRRAARYRLSFNLDPEATLLHCVEQHGDSWLYPDLRTAYLAMMKTNHTRSTVHVWGVELWRRATEEELEEQRSLAAQLKEAGKSRPDAPDFGKPKYATVGDTVRRIIETPNAKSKVKSLALPGWVMVAGDLGASVGGSYCSMTGWRDQSEDGAGTVLLAALGRHLCARGFDFWDFGMSMPYKQELGAVKVPRRAFVTKLRKTRERTGLWLGWGNGTAKSRDNDEDDAESAPDGARNAKDVIKDGAARANDSGDANNTSKDAKDAKSAKKTDGAANCTTANAANAGEAATDSGKSSDAAAAAAADAAAEGAVSKQQQKRDAKAAARAQAAAMTPEERAAAFAAKGAEIKARQEAAAAAAAAAGAKKT